VPELPEVETIVRGLNEKVLGRTFIDIWTDSKKIVKKPESFEQFKKEIKGKTILKIWRRGKNILFDLSGNKVLLIHQKLTGHLLHGTWSMKHRTWQPKERGPLEEKINTYIHLLFTLDNGKMVALSDLRKFGKAELWETEELKKELSSLGPEPLDRDFDFEEFKRVLLKTRGKIKKILMDQKVIAGIGNIYSDEILWQAKVNPLRQIKTLNKKELKKIYKAIKEVLKKAVELRGTSTSDYRDIEGKKGFFQKQRKVYRREGEKCSRCGAIIKKIKLAGRSARFCPKCQKV